MGCAYLCLAGDALAHVEGCGLADRVIPLVQVFARVSPEQKELVLQVCCYGCCFLFVVADGFSMHLGVPSTRTWFRRDLKQCALYNTLL
jgi:hypothetical protein